MKIFQFLLLYFPLSMNAEAQLKIAVPTLATNLNHLEIHSVSEYVLFDDVLRSLVKFDSNGEIGPNLAESWEIKDDFKKFILKIKDKQLFSDNSKITAIDVKNSLNYLIANPNIVHGDGKQIKKITILNENLIEIELLDRNPFFLTEISSPEYRIIKINSPNYNITSGPYSISENNSSKTKNLKINPNFPFDFPAKYNEIQYFSYEKENLKNLVNFDLIWPSSTMSKSEINEICKKGFYIYELNLGFSYWLNLNPNSLNKAERIFIKSNLDSILNSSNFFKENGLTRSKQLFLPYGPGRLNESEINIINTKLDNSELKSLKIISALLPKKIQLQLELELKKSLPSLKIDYYSDFSEYSLKIAKKNYDISLVNNDLSSIDLRSSILVTFNNSRPLVWIEKNNINYLNLLKEINTDLNSLSRNLKIKKLSEQLLNDTIIYPLYYKYGFILVKNGIDLTQLNKSGAETFSWKIK